MAAERGDGLVNVCLLTSRLRPGRPRVGRLRTVASRVVAGVVVAGVELAGVAPVLLVVQGGVGAVARPYSGQLAAAGRITVGAPVRPHISRVQLGGLVCTELSLARLATEARVEGEKSRVRLVDITGRLRVVAAGKLRFGNFVVARLEHLVEIQGVAVSPATSRSVHFISVDLVGGRPSYSSSEIRN